MRAIELIPLFGFVLARGRCRTCGTPIAWLHPAIELGCAIFAMLACAILPWDRAAWVAAASLLLLTLAILDLRHFWLPDRLTLPFGALGLLSALGGFPPLTDRLIGAFLGWLSLFLIAFAYRKLRNRTGLGAGDAKLLGAIGAWTGWQLLPFILLGASLLGFAVAATLAMTGRRIAATTRLPFGILLATAALPAVYWTALA